VWEGPALSGMACCPCSAGTIGGIYNLVTDVLVAEDREFRDDNAPDAQGG
jgi:hypothetical protein